jgi:murein L,D-transpeptidase YcbB/YkuD
MQLRFRSHVKKDLNDSGEAHLVKWKGMLKWGQKSQQVQQIIEIMHSHHLAHWKSSSTSDSLIAKQSYQASSMLLDTAARDTPEITSGHIGVSSTN